MRAVRFHCAHDIRVENVPDPTTLGATQMIVKPLWCGICGTDLHEYQAGPIVVPTEPHPLTGAKAPQILGHEFSAEIVEVGSEVKGVQRGDRISVMPLASCGKCYYCARGLRHLCTTMGCVGLSWDGGGMAEYTVINDYHANKLPDTVSDQQGALIEPAAVALYAVDRGGVTAGSSVLITGAGPIGVLAALACHAAGASQIFISEPNPRRAAKMAEFGVATQIFDPTDGELVQKIRDLTEGVGVDVAIECVGNQHALNTCVDAVRSQGAVVQAGLHVGNATVEPMKWALKDIRIEGTWCYPVTIWPRIIGMIANGKFPVEKLIHDLIDADDVVAKGFDALSDKTGDKMKILINPQLAR